MIVAGIWIAVQGNWFGGLWWVFIGWFLLSAAQESYAQVAIRNTLAGVNAADIMTQDVPTMPRDFSLENYVHEVLRTGRRCHIVTGNGAPVGLVTFHAAQGIPRDEWPNTSIQAAMRPMDKIKCVSPSKPLLGVLERMQSEEIIQIHVLNDCHITETIPHTSIYSSHIPSIPQAHYFH